LRGSVYGAEDLDSARELGFVVLSCDQLRNYGPGSYASLVRERAGRRPVFLSFDIDVLDPAFAPGTGTPEVGGLSTAEALSFVRALRGVELAGADVVEVSPPYDGPAPADGARRRERRVRDSQPARARRSSGIAKAQR
jgi:arginase family enzyme